MNAQRLRETMNLKMSRRFVPRPWHPGSGMIRALNGRGSTRTEDKGDREDASQLRLCPAILRKVENNHQATGSPSNSISRGTPCALALWLNLFYARADKRGDRRPAIKKPSSIVLDVIADFLFRSSKPCGRELATGHRDPISDCRLQSQRPSPLVSRVESSRVTISSSCACLIFGAKRRKKALIEPLFHGDSNPADDWRLDVDAYPPCHLCLACLIPWLQR